MLTRWERVESRSCSSTAILRVPVDDRIRSVSMVAVFADGLLLRSGEDGSP